MSARASAAVAIAAERVQRKNLEAALRKEAERLIETQRINFDAPEGKEKWIESVTAQALAQVEKQVLPERFRTSLPDQVRPREFDSLSRAVPAVSPKLVQDFERMFLKESAAFAVNYTSVPSEIEPSALEELLLGLKPVFDRNRNKVLVLASPHEVGSELSERLRRDFGAQVFLFGSVPDYGRFLEYLLSGQFSRSSNPELAKQFHARAQEAYQANGQESKFGTQALLTSSQVVGAETFFNGLLVSQVPRRFLDRGDFRAEPQDLFSAQLAFSVVTSGESDASQIRKLPEADYLLISHRDRALPQAFDLSLNPAERDGILTQVETLRAAYQKLSIAA